MTTKTEMEKQIAELEKELTKAENHDPVAHKDKTRSIIALIMVIGYFVLIICVMLGIPAYNILVTKYFGGGIGMHLSLKDTLSMISAIIGAPFGFVVGYYFKGSENS